jgi:hypothetical protein
VLSFVDDLDDWVVKIARRGIEPAKRETYDNGVTKVIYRDAEGNEISFGGRLGRRHLHGTWRTSRTGCIRV